MVVDVHLKPNSKFPKIVKEGSLFIVYTRSKPIQGAANKEMLQLLSEYFDVAQTRLDIIKGFKSKQKKVKISYG